MVSRNWPRNLHDSRMILKNFTWAFERSSESVGLWRLFIAELKAGSHFVGLDRGLGWGAAGAGIDRAGARRGVVREDWACTTWGLRAPGSGKEIKRNLNFTSQKHFFTHKKYLRMRNLKFKQTVTIFHLMWVRDTVLSTLRSRYRAGLDLTKRSVLPRTAR